MTTTSSKRPPQNHVELSVAPSNLAKFWKRVSKTSDCWNWIGAKDSQGYGRFYIGSKPIRSHRYSYLIANGSLPTPIRLFVLHRCDNPSCVNPEHLYLGTKAMNTADMMRRGRCGGFVKQTVCQ